MTFFKKIICLVLLYLCSQNSNAASKLFPGYYITNESDTVHCQIEFGDWYRSPESIQIELDNTKKSLTAREIKGFGVLGLVDYRSASVTYHINPINGTDLPEKYSDSTTTKTVFMKVLIQGPYSLYDLELTARN